MLGLGSVVFESLAEQSSDVVLLATPAGRLLFVNAAACRLLDLDPPAPAEGLELLDLFAEADVPFAREAIFGDVEREGRWRGDYRLRNARTGAPVFLDLELFPLRDASGEPFAIAAVGRDTSERRRADTRLRALVDAGAALAHALDDSQTFEGLAQLIVRTLATLCVIDTFPDSTSDRGEWESATSHVDRSAREYVRALAIPAAFDLPVSHPVARVYRDGSSTLVARLDDEWIEGAGGETEYAAAWRSLGVHSMLTVPLVATGNVLGALTVARGREYEQRAGFAESYNAEDLFFVEELGRRAGAALESARLYERQRAIAVRLQAASLPSRLPSAKHLRLDAEYRPGSAEATIGGDWYDAFLLEDGRVVLTVGDVLGHGLEAAVTMGKLRQAMQAAAMVEPDPSVMLEVADQTLQLHVDGGFATALAALYDLRDRSLVFATAGHPAPLLRHSDGVVEELESPGLMLGVRSGAERPVQRVALPERCALTFYTDGLVEATRDINEGRLLLRSVLEGDEIWNERRPARAMVEAVLGGERASDDIAVLVALIEPAG